MSAYQKYHSTETAVVNVYNDLLLEADQGQMSALRLLDLTAAFDMVDHELLLLCLERQFGVRGVALQWFGSYLSETGRIQTTAKRPHAVWQIFPGAVWWLNVVQCCYTVLSSARICSCATAVYFIYCRSYRCCQ